MKKTVILTAYLCLISCLYAERTIIVKSDGTGNYPTIQNAIDAAQPGDEIVLEPGTFTGPGNFNLDFHGKAITVRSQNPENVDCLQNTIIDAQGQGIIARFINDEKSETVFEGFTLGPGNTQQDVRGSAGLFEFSINARPTTRNLRHKPVEPVESAAVFSNDLLDSTFICPGMDNPPTGRIWNGLNPFYQPANTTNYYGSGDVNLDGQVTTADILLAQDIVNGQSVSNIRADVNGDSLINSADILLLTNAVNSGAILPAWWNQLTTREQRNNWITKFMSLDKTDQYIYYSSFFVCHHFAYQTYVHGAFERDDFATESTEYDGGQTVYNLPVYHTLVSSPSNHAINAILVGDDPNNFDDWRFVEPQNDLNVVPGQWNMLYGTTVSIGNRYNSQGDMVSFLVEATGRTRQYLNPEFIRTRPAPPSLSVDNRKDLWHPTIIPHAGTGLLLFEKMREDLSRTTDIFMTDITNPDYELAASITNRFHFSRLLDATRGPDGSIHLLFESKSGTDQQNLFHGIFDPVNQMLEDVSQVAEGLRLAAMGRIEVTASNDIFIFWFENIGYSGTYQMGIHWTKSTETGWQTPQLLTSSTRQQQTGDWVNRQFAWYIFDTEVMDDGRVMLVYIESIFPNAYLTQCIYNGSWVQTRIASEGAQGLDLCKSREGTVHLAYWVGSEPQICYTEGTTPPEGRGDIYHRMFNGTSWSGAALIDNTYKASAVRIEAGPDNTVCMIWERRIGNTVAAVWNCRRSGAWGVNEVLNPASGFDVWYPAISALQDGRIVAAWSARNNGLVTIETMLLDDPGGDILPVSFIGDLDGDLDVNLSDFAQIAAAWQTQSGDLKWKSISDIGIPPDDQVDIEDLLMFCQFWLVEPLPEPEYFEEGFETGDFSAHPWQQAGNAPWSIVTNQTAQGNFAAKSGTITHNQTSSLQIEMDFAGSRITFYRKISSEQYFDFLRFYVDGIKQKEWSGEVGWAEESIVISPGHHIFTWTYEKDDIVTSGSDCVWIDGIRTLP